MQNTFTPDTKVISKNYLGFHIVVFWINLKNQSCFRVFIQQSGIELWFTFVVVIAWLHEIALKDCNNAKIRLWVQYRTI